MYDFITLHDCEAKYSAYLFPWQKQETRINLAMTCIVPHKLRLFFVSNKVSNAKATRIYCRPDKLALIYPEAVEMLVDAFTSFVDVAVGGG